MENPRPEKVAVVEEVREKLTGADAVVLTEYRGLTVGALAELRSALRPVGGEYKVYKNTLVRRAVSELELGLEDQLTGPTALAFVGNRPDGSPGDAVLVAKALQAFAKANPLLVVKGGVLGDQVLDAAAVKALSEVAPRDELLARLAGGLAAPMRELAGLLQAVPQKMAYALSALIEAGGAPGAPADAPVADEPASSDDAGTAEEAADEAADASGDDAVDDTDDTNDETAEEATDEAAETENDTPAEESAGEETE